MDYFDYIFKSQIEKCIFRSINSLKVLIKNNHKLAIKLKCRCIFMSLINMA